jgi:hypothetical protein
VKAESIVLPIFKNLVSNKIKLLEIIKGKGKSNFLRKLNRTTAMSKAWSAKDSTIKREIIEFTTVSLFIVLSFANPAAPVWSATVLSARPTRSSGSR